MRRCRPMLGTFVEASVHGVDEELALRAMQAAFDAVARVDKSMSFHREDSDLARVNRAAVGARVTVDPWFTDLLLMAQALHEASDGVFDCAVGDALVERGLLPRHAREHDARATVRDVVVEAPGLVRVTRTACLDFGGIAKGYAVDRAIDAISALGVERAVINAGGDMRVLGPSPEAIHVRRANALISLGELADGAIATSQAFASDERRTSGAIVRPRERTLVEGDALYSVVAPLCAFADGLTKVLAITGATDHPCFGRFDATPIVH